MYVLAGRPFLGWNLRLVGSGPLVVEGHSSMDPVLKGAHL